MPLKRQPKTLYTQSLEMTVYTLIVDWSSRTYAENKIHFNELLLMLPPTVLNNVINKLIKAYVETVNSSGDEYKSMIDGSLADFLECILSIRVTRLDLTTLCKIDSVLCTGITILKLIGCMRNLTLLSFKALTHTHIIPVSGNDLLKEIGQNCPKIKYLDVSYNHTVTNEGLKYLCKQSDNPCPFLQKLLLYGCSVTIGGVSKALKHLRRLKYIGFNEVGMSLLRLYENKCDIKLRLVYINNMGCEMKTGRDLSKLRFSGKMSNVVFNMCPYINEIKVIVTDASLEHVVLGPYIESVHLTFDFELPFTVGRGLNNIIQNYGVQLVTLSLDCPIIRTNHIFMIGKHCTELETLTINCRQICDHNDIVSGDFLIMSAKKFFINLKNFFFTVQLNKNFEVVMRLIPFIIYNSVLENFYFSLNSPLFTYSWVEEFFTLYDTSSLQSFMIDVPPSSAHTTLDLNMASIDLVLAKCPCIKTVGNLFAWCISVKEMKQLCRKREIENSDIEFFYHPIPVQMNVQLRN